MTTFHFDTAGEPENCELGKWCIGPHGESADDLSRASNYWRELVSISDSKSFYGLDLETCNNLFETLDKRSKVRKSLSELFGSLTQQIEYTLEYFVKSRTASCQRQSNWYEDSGVETNRIDSYIFFDSENNDLFRDDFKLSAAGEIVFDTMLKPHIRKLKLARFHLDNFENIASARAKRLDTSDRLQMILTHFNKEYRPIIAKIAKHIENSDFSDHKFHRPFDYNLEDIDYSFNFKSANRIFFRGWDLEEILNVSPQTVSGFVRGLCTKDAIENIGRDYQGARYYVEPYSVQMAAEKLKNNKL